MATLKFEDLAFSVPQDRRYYSVEHENNTERTKFEGGYVASRPKFPRNPVRRTWRTGFTDMSPADRAILEGFWNTVAGGSVVFQWLDVHAWEGAKYLVPGTDAAPYRFYVRFAMEKLKFETKGYGPNLRYDCPELILEEV